MAASVVVPDVARSVLRAWVGATVFLSLTKWPPALVVDWERCGMIGLLHSWSSGRDDSLHRRCSQQGDPRVLLCRHGAGRGLRATGRPGPEHAIEHAGQRAAHELCDQVDSDSVIYARRDRGANGPRCIDAASCQYAKC